MGEKSTDSGIEHDHQACIDDAIKQAEAICEREGLRLTALRRRVLELVWAGHKPVGAYDVLDALTSDGRRAAPPTVYRTLEFLMDAGLVHRLDSLNAYIGCPDPEHQHSGQFLICRACERVIEISATSIQAKIEAMASEAGFIAEQQMLEVRGICAKCQAADPGR